MSLGWPWPGDEISGAFYRNVSNALLDYSAPKADVWEFLSFDNRPNRMAYFADNRRLLLLTYDRKKHTLSIPLHFYYMYQPFILPLIQQLYMNELLDRYVYPVHTQRYGCLLYVEGNIPNELVALDNVQYEHFSPGNHWRGRLVLQAGAVDIGGQPVLGMEALL